MYRANDKEDSLIVQSILFDKEKFTLTEAKNWLKKHDYKSDKVDETDEYYRFRQRDPDDFDPDSFRTKEIEDGVKFIMGKLKQEEESFRNMDRINKIKNQVQHRTLQITRDMVDKDRRVIKLSFSSSSPIEHWFGMLSLDHKLTSVRLGRLNNGGALLWNHNTDDQFGVIEAVYIDEAEGKGYAEVRFSKSARGEEMYQDVLDGIRTNVSCAFMIHELILERQEEEMEFYHATDWEPLEISLVSVPADISVGVGRSIAEAKKEIEYLKNKIDEIKANEIINKQSQSIKETKKMEQDEKEKLEKEVLEAERKRIEEITALAKRHNLDPTDAIKNGTTIEVYRGIVLEKIGNQKPLYNDPFSVGLNAGEVKEYSLSRLIKTMLPTEKTFGQNCPEREISDQIGKDIGKRAKGVYIPQDVFAKEFYRKQIHKRDLTAGGIGTGAEWVQKVWYGQEFIELLRNKAVLAKHGARVWTGLNGNVYVPKLAAGVTFGVRATETGALVESTPTTAQLLLTPKSGGTFVDISKSMIYQSNPNVESTITDDILLAIALGIDRFGLHGSGSNGEPTGVVNTSGIGSVAGASYTFLSALEHITDVMTANADVASMAYVTTPAIWGELGGRTKVSNYPSFILDTETNKMAGYPVEASNQVSAGYIIFGDFSQVIVGLWSGVDLIVDNVTQAVSGLIRLVADQYFDIGVRQPGAFSVASSFS